MFSSEKNIVWKYFKIELGLFLFVCYLSPVISDMEYSGYEEKNIWNFTASLEYRLVYGTFSMILYSSYYWLVLKMLVFKKQMLYLALSIIAYIVVYHLFSKYENWVVNKLFFLSTALRARALRDYLHTELHFIISYALTRLVFTFIGFAFLIRSLQQDEEVKVLKEHQLTNELNYLKAQLQPHFFFNTLNNIYALAISKSEDTARVVAKLAEIMRYILYEADQLKVPFSKEVNFLENYVALERIRHADNININFEVQCITEIKWIEPLLLLPLIENAFKHGIQHEIGKGFVNIVICIAETEINLQVENSKPTQPNQKTDGGMGLKTLQKRLALLYPGRYQLEAEDAFNSYQVILTVQMI